jgi:KaiC/GvpD/RAD55 family RecA-like ATPase
LSFSDSQLEDIRSRIDLVDFITRRGVDLKKHGADYLGLCPFHAEKTPSFNVRPAIGRFKCFGCQEAGDAFGYAMKADGLSFPDAVRQVAAEAGVEIEDTRAAAGGRNRSGRAQGSAGRSGQGRSGGGGRNLETLGGSQQGPASPAHSERGNVVELGAASKARIDQTYDYRSRKGLLVYQVCRMVPKSFRQRRPMPNPTAQDQWVWTMGRDRRSGLPAQPTILYRIPELANALEAGDPIWVTEGEKDADALFDAGEVATCNTGGAGAWRDELAKPFKDYRGTVKVVQDRDEPGQAHALSVFESLAKAMDLEGGGQLCIVEAAAGKDSADHLAAGKGVTDFVQVWPLPEDLLQTDPARFKRIMLRRALESPTTVLSHTEHADWVDHDQPLFLTGLSNLLRPTEWEGCVVISGLPSTGKSYVAIASLVDNAARGWDSYYFTCEMAERTVRKRAARAVASSHLEGSDWLSPQVREEAAMASRTAVLPDRFNVVDVGIGVTIEDIIEFLIEHLSDRPTLCCIDSVSSLVDNMATDPADSWGMADLRTVQRWTTGVSKLSKGQIAFLLLSEINKEGRAKGRSLDHRCDYALAMTTADVEGAQDQVKEIRTTKSWHGPTGRLGNFVLWWANARLARVDDGPY